MVPGRPLDHLQHRPRSTGRGGHGRPPQRQRPADHPALDSRFELFKPVWSPDGRKFLVGCFDVQAQIDKLCVMNANGRNLHVVVATPDPLNFPAWGAHPPKH